MAMDAAMIERLIREGLPDARVSIEDLRGDGDHYAAHVESASFKGKAEDLRSIGQKLGVATVLEGSVRKAESRVRVTAQLIDVKDGFHLWSQTFDRELNDIFAVQDEIASEVVAALRVKLVPGKSPTAVERRTADPEAYNQYLLARRFFDRGSPAPSRGWAVRSRRRTPASTT